MHNYQFIKESLDSIQYKEIKTNKKITYINLSCGFDIETSSFKYRGDKAASMYIWMLGIGHNKPIYYGRNWNEFVETCNYLRDYYNLSEKHRLVVYVHNFAYEFQFMCKYFDWIDVFAVDERKPIRATIAQGIEFRDSYILSGYSLANTAKNLTKYKVEKKVGDLDYSLIRHNETPLTEAELGYCKSDIEVITAYIQEEIETYGDISKIPMTNTGRVRKYVRDKCYYTDKSHKKTSAGKYNRYRKIMRDLTMDSETYKQLKRAFMGGFTHANADYSGKTLENVASVDFTSSYPAVMVSEKFPMTRFRSVEITSMDQFKAMCKERAMVFDIRFNNLRPRIFHESYLSESKCTYLSKPVINNGRVFSADVVETTMTEVDFAIMSQVYAWDSIALTNVKFAYKNYLPKAIVESILDLYQKKTELKDVEGSEVEYLLSKGMLNSIYGMCVTDIVKDETIFEDGRWGVNQADLETELQNYNESANRFLYYPWGIWVTAYARRNLWTGIIAVGEDYIYSDTDSLKILNYDDHKEYIEKYDSNVVRKMEAVCDYHRLDKKLLRPKTKHNVEKLLGVWDYEGTYSRFKTLGAKRYLVEKDGKLALTVAGLSKQNGLQYLKDKYGDNKNVFDNFKNNLYIPAEKTGKMTHTYIDDETDVDIIDYQGNDLILVNVKSSIHLEPCDFTLSISGQYGTFLEQFSKGYLFVGTKYI